MRTKLLAAACILGIVLLAGLIGVRSLPRPVCPDPIGWAYADSCVEADLIPSISVGQMTTQCFYYKAKTEYSTLSYITGDFNCGPFAPYASLTYELYDENCDSLVYSGAIYPTPVNAFIWLDTAKVYRICYTWTALCEQFSACPIINPSFLPLTWLSFSGRYLSSENVIKLGWKTASEVNCSHFVVEKQIGGKWISLGLIQATGNTTYNVAYSFNDYRIEADNYYRLKQVDRNGHYTFSKIILVRTSGDYMDCYYMTMIGEIINSDIATLPKGLYIRRCQDRFTLIAVTQ